MRNRYSVKSRKIEHLDGWLKKFQAKYPGIAYRLNGKDISCLKGMSLAQIEFTLSMVACAYAVGNEENRQWHKEYRASQVKWKQERRPAAAGKLKLVVSHA